MTTMAEKRQRVSSSSNEITSPSSLTSSSSSSSSSRGYRNNKNQSSAHRRMARQSSSQSSVSHTNNNGNGHDDGNDSDHDTSTPRTTLPTMTTLTLSPPASSSLLLGGRPLPYVVTFGILTWLPLIDSMSLMYTSRACRSILTTYVSRAHEICIHDHHHGTRSAEDLLPHIGGALQLVQRYTITLHVLCVSFALNWNTNPVEDTDECVRIQLMLQDIIRVHRAHFQRLTADWRFKSVALLSMLISCPCLRAFNPHAAWMPRPTVDILLLRAIKSCPMIDTLWELHTKEPFASSVLFESSVRAILAAEEKLPLKQLGVDWLGVDSMRLLQQQTTLTRLDFGLAVETSDQQLEAYNILENTWRQLPVLERLTITVRDHQLPSTHSIVWRFPHLTILTLRELADDTDWPVLPPIIAPLLTKLTGPLSFLHLANVLHHSPCLTSIDCDLHTRGNMAEVEAGERALMVVMADGAGARLENLSQRGEPLPLSFLTSITTNCLRLHTAIIEAPKHACTAEDIIRLFMKLPKLKILGVDGPGAASGTCVSIDDPSSLPPVTAASDRNDSKRTPARRYHRGPATADSSDTTTTINGAVTRNGNAANGNDREYRRDGIGMINRQSNVPSPIPPSTLPAAAIGAANAVNSSIPMTQRRYTVVPAADQSPIVLHGLEELWLDICNDDLFQRLQLPSLLRMRLKGDSIKIEDAARLFEHAPKLIDLSMKGAHVMGCSSPLRPAAGSLSSSLSSLSSSPALSSTPSPVPFDVSSPLSHSRVIARDLVPGVVPSIIAAQHQRRHGLESLSLCHGRCHADTMFTLLTWCHQSLRSLSLCADGLGIILVADLHSLGMPVLETFEWRGQLIDHPSLGVVCRFARSLPNLKALTVPGSLTEEARQWVKTQTKGGKTKGRSGLDIQFTIH